MNELIFFVHATILHTKHKQYYQLYILEQKFLSVVSKAKAKWMEQLILVKARALVKWYHYLDFGKEGLIISLSITSKLETLLKAVDAKKIIRYLPKKTLALMEIKFDIQYFNLKILQYFL